MKTRDRRARRRDTRQRSPSEVSISRTPGSRRPPSTTLLVLMLLGAGTLDRLSPPLATLGTEVIPRGLTEEEFPPRECLEVLRVEMLSAVWPWL